MKRMVLVGALVGAFAASTAFAQTTEAKKPAMKASTDGQAGHTAPKPQPPTESAPPRPTGQLALGSVHIPKGVKADGKALRGRHLSGAADAADTATPDAKGQTGIARALGRVREGRQGRRPRGRHDHPAGRDRARSRRTRRRKANSSKVETLKGGDYVRLWINKGGNHYLVHFPA